MKLLRKIKLDVILTSTVLVALGVIMLLWPDKTQSYICYSLAVIAIAVGVCFSLDYRKKDPMNTASNYSLACALAMAMVGIYVLIHAEDIIKVLPLVLSFLVLFSGLIKLQNSWDMKKLQDNNWMFHLVVSLIGIVFGFLLMLEIIDSDVETWIGVGLIYSGFTDLISSFSLARARLDAERSVPPMIEEK